MKLKTWNWISPSAWYDQQNWFVLGSILVVICVVMFAIYMKGKHAQKAGKGFRYVELLSCVVAPIGLVVLLFVFTVYSMNAEFTNKYDNDAAYTASADANIDRMERYYGIRNVSMNNDDRDIMTTYMGMDTRHIDGDDMKYISNHQYDEQHDSRMANITFTQNGKEYTGTITSHTGVIQVFRNDGTILKPVNR